MSVIEDLYSRIASRKSKPADHDPYHGGNGRVDRCVALIRSGLLRNSGTLLDVGGGIGDLAAATSDLFTRRVTADISQVNLLAAQAKGSETLLCDVDAHGLKGVDDGSIDLVTALDFIEHIVDPEKFARECFRVLKPGGHVFVNTPNIAFFRHIETLIAGHMPHTSGDREVFHGGHLAFFTIQDIFHILREAGFVSCTMHKDVENFVQPPPFWIQTQRPQTDQDGERASMFLGNPNALVSATKPSLEWEDQ